MQRKTDMDSLVARVRGRGQGTAFIFCSLLLLSSRVLAQTCDGGVLLKAGDAEVSTDVSGYGGQWQLDGVLANVAPSVYINNILPGATFISGQQIGIAAVASDADGSVARVDFYKRPNIVNGVDVLIGTDAKAPYSYTWAGAAPGNYILTAKVTDNASCSAFSSGIPITVVAGVNAAPAITLLTPSNGSAFTSPASISLTASASDSDGIVTKVEFFNGATLLGSDGLSPYSFSWTNVPAGSYTLTAKATDDGGAVTTSAAATVTVAGPLPAVSLTSPAAGSSFNDPASITLAANASITSGTITKVEFLDGAVVRATDTTSPYSAVWAGGTVGSHSLTARATSSLGTVATSSPVAILITNPAPSVSLTSPSSGASFVAPASITLCATASDSNGSITKVEFFNGAALIGTDTISPYCFTWSNVAAGSYSLTAKATDNGGAVTSSAPVTISVVNPQPSVTLTVPLGGSTFSDPASINLSANASIASGTITKVEFLDGTVVVGTDTTAPYSMLWSGATIGSHTLKARATSSFATIATSSAVTISVTNPSPSVALTAPANGASFAAPANITLSANAGDANGTVTKVEFFSGATLLNTDTTAPYSFVWNNVVAGSYTLTAKATDNAGATATSSSLVVSVDAPNVPPVVALTAPLQGASFAAPATIDLVAGASDTDGTVIQVEFYNGATLLATSTVAPYAFKWLSVPAGTYTITAKAYDDAFAFTVSAPVTVTVSAPVVPPTVSLTAPADGAHVVAPTSITLSADASDSDGSINQVEFYSGSTLIGTDVTAPYSFAWAAVSPGTYTLTARAYDDADNSTQSAARTITVDAPLPGVTLTSPLSGASFDDPASVTVSATATTTSGTIAQVEFLDGAALIGTDTTEPYSVPWNGGAIGSHSLTARATSSLGTVAMSTPVSITITNPPPSVALAGPTSGATFTAPANITVSATASDANGTVAQVEFFNGATLLSSDAAAPYTFAWGNVPAGSYSLTAKATDNDGAMTVSPPVSVVIDPQANVAPTVSLTAPLTGASFVEPATINLAADASDVDGSVTQMEFYNGATLLGTDTVAPYTFKWIDVPVGAYTLTAKALDDTLASSTSAAVSVTVVACPPMTVALTAPLDGTVFNAPATVNLAAGASTCAGSISQVEFYQGTTLLNTDTTAPFAYTWSPVGAGGYDLTAKAYNTLGDSVVSPISSITVNAAPFVALTAPADGSSATGPTDVVLTADASDSDGTISKVEFYSGATLLGTTLTAPYAFTWNAVPIGDYTLSAIAYDNHNAATVSAPVSFGVTACAPTVALVAPLDGALFTAPADIDLAAGVSTCAGSSIERVEFYQGSTLLDTDLTAPFAYTWPSVLPGTYALTAKVYNTLGQTAVSAVASVVVNNPPQVALTTPVDGSSVVAPGDFVLSATASDTDGTIARVEYFNGVTPLGSATVAPYAVNWLGVGEGTYILTAIAYDDHDVGTASAPVTVAVTAAGVNESPTVVMTSPANASVAGAPAMWALAADASDSDGSIARVEFYDGANLIATDDTTPYAFNWTGVAAGEYTLTATAYDDRGASATSAPILVTVTTDAPPPPVGPPAADPISDGVGATAGEFRVDESGAATYSIPLFAEPGTAGVTPQMALVYSSQGGDGPMGRGWAISGLSSISRCRTSREATDFIVAGQVVDGDPPPLNFSASDRFCLDGQRLLMIAPAAATCPAVAGSVVTEYRTELESYQRVCAYTAADTANPRYFTVDRKDGSTSWYGDRDSSTSAATAGNRGDGALLSNASASNGKTISWAQTRFQDSVGNYIDYTYRIDPGSVLGGAQYPGEQLISEVRYTGKLNLQGQSGPNLAPYAKLVFNYAAMPTAEYRSGYLAGSQAWQTQYLLNVESISDDVVLRHYALEYQTSVSGSGQRELRQLTECRDGALGTCLAPTVFNWTVALNAFETSEFVTTTNFKSLVSFRMGDVDGDGRQDVAWFKSGGAGCTGFQLYVSFGELDSVTGNLTFNQISQTPYCSLHDINDIDGSWHLLDYDGDGKDDLFVSGAAALWSLLPSVGRPAAGARVFDASNDLLSKVVTDFFGNIISITMPTFGDSADKVMLADLNGDGLLDVVYPSGGTHMVRLMERTGSGSELAYAWGNERKLTVSSTGAICDSLSATCTFNGVSSKQGKVFLNDFNGDARSDLLFNFSEIKETGHCLQQFPVPESYAVPVDGEVMPVYDAATSLLLVGTVAEMSGASCFTTRKFTVAATVRTITSDMVVISSYARWLRPDAGVSNSTTFKDFRFADFNGDGLTDVALNASNGDWTARLNTGVGFDGTSAFLSTVPNDDQLQLVDVNGDGRTDFVYPQESDSGNRPFHARLANADGTFAADTLVAGGMDRACESASCDLRGRVYLFSDFDADGSLDFVRIKLDATGHYASRAAATSRYQPRDTVTSIVNGLGATTTLTYLPLTNREVYRSDAGSRNSLDWGRGSPVQDVNGPSYVVAKAQSSAPTFADDAATSAVYYRYAGAKAQAGGRGYLGFRAITTIESNFAGQQVHSTTEYRQNFPYIGLPIRSTKHVVTGAYVPAACFSVISNACFQPAGTSFPTPGGTLISENVQVWDAPAWELQWLILGPVVQQPIAVETLGTNEKTFEPTSGTLVSHVDTMFEYTDGYGNATLTSVDTFAGASTTPLSTVSTVNTYVNDIMRWRLGRLTTSTVSHKRGADTVTRATRFTYDMSGDYSGLLTGEYLQEGVGADQSLKTLHDYDVFGNKIATYTCSDHFDDAACRSTAIEFNPTDPLSILRYSRTLYDSRGRFVVSTRERFATGERATQTVSARSPFGDVVEVSDVNGTRVHTQYGQLGRSQYTWSQTVAGATLGNPADGQEGWSSFRFCGTGADEVDCPTGTRFREQVTTEGGSTGWTYFDVLGRPVLSAAQSFNAGQVGKDFAASCTYYDARGQVDRTSEPFFLAEPASQGEPAFAGGNPCRPASARYWTLNTTDVVGRVVQVTQPDGSTNVSAYQGDGVSIAFTDPLGNHRTEVRNVLGELVTSTDSGGLSTQYEYDAIGNLIAVRRDAGRGEILTTMEYDALGRKIAQHDPDAGNWTYEYNALGEQIAQRDSFEDRTSIEQWRDARGRVYQQTSGRDSGPEALHQYQFDTATPGQLSVESSSGAYQAFQGEAGTDTDFRRSFSYDTLGRVIGSVTTIDGQAYSALTAYDDLGRAWRSQDPSGAWLKTEFDARGYAVRLCDSSVGDSGKTCASGSPSTWGETLETDARGNVLAERRGGTDALLLTRFFEASTGRLLDQCAGINCGLLDESYTWDSAGNLSARDKAGQYSESFSYDPLNRLIGTQTSRPDGLGGSTVVASTAQTYDKLGNICSKTIAGQVQDYTYGGPSGCGINVAAGSGGDFGSPHAVTQANGGSFNYDQHGNQTQASYSDLSKNRKIAYTAADQANQISMGDEFAPSLRTRFWYGSDGSRYKREDDAPSSTTKRTLYVGNLEIVSQGGITTYKRYVAGVMVQDVTGSAVTNQFLFHDHIGSVIRAVSANGAVIEGMDYGAFGERRGYTDPTLPAAVPQTTTRGFTGHEMLDGTDVIHMNGRIYDSALGRFLQADPVIQEPNNPQNFNRYTYVLNNPLSLTDPSGFSFLGKVFKKLRPFIAIAIAIYAPQFLAFLGEFGAVVAGGFLSGVVSTGTLKGGLFGAFSAAAFAGVGAAFDKFGTAGNFAGSNFSSGAFGAKVLAHGITGGVMAELQGGKFGSGFAAAGVTQAFSGGIDNLDNGTVGISAERVFAAAALGGTTSVLTGGKFANAAITAAFSRAFNDERHGAALDALKEELRFLPGFASDVAVGFGDGAFRAITFGFGDLNDVRNAFGIGPYIADQDVYSGAFTLGGIDGGFALGGAVGLVGKGSRGWEYSHAIPSRFLRRFGLESFFGRTPLNGTYVPRVFHALTDKFRFQFMPRLWKQALPFRLPQGLQQLLRTPPSVAGGVIGSTVDPQSNSGGGR